MNIEQAKKLDKLGIFLNKGIPVGYESAEKMMMEWLSKETKQGIFITSEVFDDLPYWEVNLYMSRGDRFVRHADLTEALVQACVAVGKGGV